MHSQHTSALNSTHMGVDAVCRIARNFGRRSYVKREEKGPFMSTSHNLYARLISYEPAHNWLIIHAMPPGNWGIPWLLWPTVYK